ncbi:SGNH/GDSL hydrolase family protein [Pusillimonas sp.]|uniref:SGNH/GDSL hydrolase family protein n=1 Tax=Burkholderiales TaxID=80840 RepID=UPI0037C6C6AD
MASAAAALAGLSFLVIGESHMLYELPESLHADLSAQGAAYVHSVGACGASAIDWVKPRQVDCGQEKKGKEPASINKSGMQTQAIKQLIAADKPDVVVLIIGDTMGSYDNETFPKAWAWQGVSSLTKEIAGAGAACVWVGPAYGRAGGKYNKRDDRVERISRFLSTNVNPCVYIDSLKFANPGQWRTFDGQHFAADGYAAWSKAIVSEVSQLPMIEELKKKKAP